MNDENREETDFFAEIRNWMDTEEAGLLLRSAARTVVSRGQGFLSACSGTGCLHGKDAVEEMFSMLAEFVLRSEKIREMICLSQGQRMEHYLCTAFFRYLMDQARHPDRDFRTYLRSRVLRVLKTSLTHDLAFHNRKAVYGLKNRPGPAALLAEDDRREIPFPFELVPSLTQEGIRSGKLLLALAEHFHAQVSEMWNFQPVWVYVADLMAWLAMHMDLNTVHKRSLEEEPEAENIPDAHVGTDPPCLQASEAEHWAGLFAARLDPCEMQIYFRRQCLNENLQTIAGKTGYKSPTSVSNRLERILEKLRSFVWECPDLSPDEQAKEDFFLFAKKLCEILEKRISAP